MAHSWGSYLGLRAVATNSRDSSHAYVGVAQVTQQIESEVLAYDYMLRRYQELGKTRMVRRLAAAPVDATRFPCLLPTSRYATARCTVSGSGQTRDMRSVVTGLFLPSWRFQGYTLREKVNLWRGKVFSRRSGLWNEMLATDMTTRVPELSLPAYFLHGRHDYTASYVLSRAYVQQLAAPVKGFYSFGDSAQSPIFEEPSRAMKILREDVLPGRTASLTPVEQDAPRTSLPGRSRAPSPPLDRDVRRADDERSRGSVAQPLPLVGSEDGDERDRVAEEAVDDVQGRPDERRRRSRGESRPSARP